MDTNSLDSTGADHIFFINFEYALKLAYNIFCSIYLGGRNIDEVR